MATLNQDILNMQMEGRIIIKWGEVTNCSGDTITVGIEDYKGTLMVFVVSGGESNIFQSFTTNKGADRCFSTIYTALDFAKNIWYK